LQISKRNFLADRAFLFHRPDMNFPPFWARGASGDFFCWRWSFQSASDAQVQANAAAQQIAERFAHGDFPPKHGGYYPNRPFREPVLQEIKNDAGELAAVITRNSYGCLVLNTARVMFVDVDLPEPKAPGLFARLFGKTSTEAPPLTEAGAIAKVENWTRSNSDWGWRIYRTRAGLRLLATHALFDPEAAASNGVFDALGADPLYHKLCQTQKCFRARLTPKPWRCALVRKPERWPFLDARAEKGFQKWEAQYQSMSFNWATCELVKKIGNEEIHPAIQPILKIHDELTKVESKLKLA
jgi:hypothetical protein